MPDQSFIKKHEHVRSIEPMAADTLEITLEGENSAWLNAHLQKEGFSVSAITPKQKTLKEFFLSITGHEEKANGS
jgi:hypothetical protein